MNRLDEWLKERARREDCPVPQGFDGRMDAILEGLPEGRRKPGPRRLRRWVVAGVLAAALCVGGVAAASGALELIARPGGFGGTAEGFQPYSAEVGASVTDQGYTLTLDGIGVDEAFITLYATVTGEEPIPRDDRGEPELWSFSLKAEGKELEFWGRDRETEWVDDYTLKVMQRCPVARTLPDVVELQVYTNELFYGLSGDWSLNLLVDKTAPDGESLVVEPRQTFTMLDHRVRADKVVVAPSGGGLVLTEVGFPPLTDFLLRDDTGHYLYVDTERYGGAGGGLPISNFIAFYGGGPSLWCPMSGSTPAMNQVEVTRFLALWTNCPLLTPPPKPATLWSLWTSGQSRRWPGSRPGKSCSSTSTAVTALGSRCWTPTERAWKRIRGRSAGNGTTTGRRACGP